MWEVWARRGVGAGVESQAGVEAEAGELIPALTTEPPALPPWGWESVGRHGACAGQSSSPAALPHGVQRGLLEVALWRSSPQCTCPPLSASRLPCRAPHPPRAWHACGKARVDREDALDRSYALGSVQVEKGPVSREAQGSGSFASVRGVRTSARKESKSRSAN